MDPNLLQTLALNLRTSKSTRSLTCDKNCPHVYLSRCEIALVNNKGLSSIDYAESTTQNLQIYNYPARNTKKIQQERRSKKQLFGTDNTIYKHIP